MSQGNGGIVAGIVSIAVVTAYGCTKSTPGGDSSLGEGRQPFVRPTPSAPYTPAKLRQVVCGDASSPDLQEQSGQCPSCEAGTHCTISYIRGQPVGACVKSNCAGDADCPGALCVCGPPNRCIPGNCRGPGDCGGRECAPGARYGGGGTFCRTEADTCATHAHCGQGMECRYENGHFRCAKEPPPPPAG